MRETIGYVIAAAALGLILWSFWEMDHRLFPEHTWKERRGFWAIILGIALITGAMVLVEGIKP